MRYSVLGFSQEEILLLQETIVDEKTNKSKVIRIDIIDLLILRDIADFMNRKNIIKYIIDEKTYFNIKYTTVLNDLPILGLKQQALSDRLNKLCHFNLLEKAVVKNQSGSYTAFRIGDKYEDIVYNDNFSTSTQIHSHKYLDTSAEVAKYKCAYYNNNYIINNSSTKKNTYVLEKCKNWRESYDAYTALIEEALNKLLVDKKYKEQMEGLYANIDYEKTITACAIYWQQEEQWETYKRKKTTKPNFISAIKNGFRFNRIYLSKYAKEINTGYPKSIEDVKDDDIKPTFTLFLDWLDDAAKKILETNRKGFPVNEKQYQRLIDVAIGGKRTLAYVTLVLNRDGYGVYEDERGFMWTYLNYIKANGLYKG